MAAFAAMSDRLARAPAYVVLGVDLNTWRTQSSRSWLIARTLLLQSSRVRGRDALHDLIDAFCSVLEYDGRFDHCRTAPVGGLAA